MGVNEFRRNFAQNFLAMLFPSACLFVKSSIFASYSWKVYARVVVLPQTGQ